MALCARDFPWHLHHVSLGLMKSTLARSHCWCTPERGCARCARRYESPFTSFFAVSFSAVFRAIGRHFVCFHHRQEGNYRLPFYREKLFHKDLSHIETFSKNLQTCLMVCFHGMIILLAIGRCLILLLEVWQIAELCHLWSPGTTLEVLDIYRAYLHWYDTCTWVYIMYIDHI